MNSTYSINMRRLLLLFRNSLIINRNLLFVIVAVFSALVIFGRISNALSGGSPFSYDNMFFLLLFISGFSLIMSINREIHDKRKSNTWLLLPASTMEKFITLLFLPTVLLAVGLIIYMTVASHVLELTIAAFINIDINGFNPISMKVPEGLEVYIGFLSPFLAGAVYFRKHAIIYTFLFLFVYSAIFGMFSLLSGLYFLGEYIPPLLPGFSFFKGMSDLGNIDTLYAMTLMEKLRITLEYWKPIVTIYWRIISPLLWWVIAFFSLKEMEQ